jgi:hypothetical protein
MKRVMLFLLASMLLFSSCSSKKKMVSPLAHAFDYEWMTAKMTMDVAAPGVEFKDISGVLRMRRDSAVWISASAMMGMESLRTLITQDSVVMVNRMDQVYLAEPLQQVAEKLHLPATLQETQTLLLGNGTNDHVAIQFGPYTAKIRYSEIHWNEPTTFPIKINKKYERMKL